MVQNNASNQILINSGNAFQRVTVVPADTNSGELSYVLIVQDPDMKDGEQNDDDQDMAGKIVGYLLLVKLYSRVAFWNIKC